MRVAFVADTHFGYARFEDDAYHQGRAAILDAANKADVLVLGGDIFDTRVPKLETLAQVAEILIEAGGILRRKADGKIAAANLIIGIHGTHERRGKDSTNPINMMARMGLLDDIHNRTVAVEKDGEMAAFSGMGGIPDDLVADAFGRLQCKPAEGALNFFIFHQTMHEYVPQAPNLASIEQLPEGYDYYLCGHMHGRAEYMGGKLLIPGSTVITQLREEEAGQKGYYTIDTGKRKAEFVAVKTRPMRIARVKLEGDGSAEARKKIEAEIAKAAGGLAQGGEKPIIRIIVEGKAAGGADIDFMGFSRQDAEVYVDGEIDGVSLADEIEQIKTLRESKATPAEYGAARLRENAAKFGISPSRADELFQKFLNTEK